MPEQRITQEYAEVVLSADASVRVTQEYAEVVLSGEARVRATQVYLEIVYDPNTLLPTATPRSQALVIA